MLFSDLRKDLVNVLFWPIQEVQEPRISGVFFVAGMTGGGRFKTLTPPKLICTSK